MTKKEKKYINEFKKRTLEELPIFLPMESPTKKYYDELRKSMKKGKK